MPYQQVFELRLANNTLITTVTLVNGGATFLPGETIMFGLLKYVINKVNDNKFTRVNSTTLSDTVILTVALVP